MMLPIPGFLLVVSRLGDLFMDVNFQQEDSIDATLAGEFLEP